MLILSVYSDQYLELVLQLSIIILSVHTDINF